MTHVKAPVTIARICALRAERDVAGERKDIGCCDQ